MSSGNLMSSICKFAGVVLLVLAVPAAGDEKADVEILSTLLAQFLAGASINDVAAHERFWSDELVYTSSNGTRFGKADILDGMRSAAPEQDPEDVAETVYSAEDVDIRVYGESAVVAFRLVGTSTDGVQHYFNTGMFLKRSGEWRAVAWHATRIPEPATPD